MRIYVCVKQVPDTAANIKLVDGTGYDPQVKYVANPYDEYGVEEAVKLVEGAGEGEVVAVCLGNDGADNSLRSIMAMGAHRSILVESDAQFIDPVQTARELAKAIKDDCGGTPDLVFTGKQSVDSEGMQTPYWLGAELGLPVVNQISGLEIDGTTATAQRELGSGVTETLSLSLPCVIGATKGLNEPRYPKLPAIMKAKKKKIDRVAPAAEAFDGFELAGMEPVAERSQARILEGETAQVVAELVNILKTEEKVI